MVFCDRTDAGRQLAKALEAYRREDAVVLGLPRGGVVLAYEIAKILKKPLDVLVVRKLGAPNQEELAIGAIGPNDVLVLNQALIHNLGISETSVKAGLAREMAELKRRMELFRGRRDFPDLRGKTAILVDDGLATGATALAAVEAVREMGAGKVVLAVPVGARQPISRLRQDVDDLVCLEAPETFQAVSLWYESFDQIDDREVIYLLEKAWGQDLGETSVLSQSGGVP